jgi:ABC-type uncharacterized transport system involved in gliding motility auxiliary subunit
MLPFTSSLERVKTSTTYVYEPLAITSSISGTQNAPIAYRMHSNWQHRDFSNPNQHVAALLSNSENSSAIVAITNGTFLNDDIISMFGSDNLNFAINSVEWLADNSGLIQLRNKYNTFPRIEKRSDSTTAAIKAYNMYSPLLLIIIILGIGYIQYRRKYNLR